MTEEAPILRLRAILSRWDGGDQEEDRDWSAMGLTFARFIADPEGAEKEIRLLLYRIWDTRVSSADAAQAICDLLAGVGVEHG